MDFSNVNIHVNVILNQKCKILPLCNVQSTSTRAKDSVFVGAQQRKQKKNNNEDNNQSIIMLAAAVKICAQPTNSPKTPSVFLIPVDVMHLVITAMSGISGSKLLDVSFTNTVSCF